MSYDLMFQKAIELQNSGALNEAEAIYLQMLQVMPENSDVWNLLGMIAQSRGDNLRAVDCFLSAVKYAPVPFFAHFFNLGLAYKSLNKPADALEMLKRATELAPDVKEIWNFFGVLQIEVGAKEEAVKSFCKALEIDGEYIDALANLCYYTNDTDRLLQLADENVNSFAANFKAAGVVEDHKQKEHYLQRAIACAPERTDGLLAMADFYRTSGDFKTSLTFYHKVLNLDNNDISALLGAADVYLAEKDFERAEKYYLKSFEQTREIAGAHLNYGILLYQTGRTAEALEEYRKAAALEPETPEISYNLALVLKEIGDFEEALGLMFNAHIKSPENQIFIINIAETLSLLFRKNAELALKIAENWQKQEPNNIFSRRVSAGMSGMTEDVDNALYAKELFDVFAETYDVSMAKLEPKIISKFKEIHGDVYGRALDLGCGTGLAADVLKTEQAVFDGVDISSQMLEKSRLKGLYNRLYQQDILSFLQENPPALSYDLVLAFDVFCYMGALDDVFAALKGVEFWFSIETADDERGKDYYLDASGRYKHSVRYVERALKNIGFSEINAFSLTLRKENGEDVCGILYQVRG